MSWDNPDEVARMVKERMREAFDAALQRYGEEIEARVGALEKRVIAAEETSKAATAQMTAVLAVLNVLTQLVPPKLPKVH